MTAGCCAMASLAPVDRMGIAEDVGVESGLAGRQSSKARAPMACKASIAKSTFTRRDWDSDNTQAVSPAWSWHSANVFWKAASHGASIFSISMYELSALFPLRSRGD